MHSQQDTEYLNLESKSTINRPQNTTIKPYFKFVQAGLFIKKFNSAYPLIAVNNVNFLIATNNKTLLDYLFYNKSRKI